MARTRSTLIMSDDIAAALTGRGLLCEYDARPLYQRNDDVAWIGRSKRVETRPRRLRQMLDELEAGGLYMGMAHAPSQGR